MRARRDGVRRPWWRSTPMLVVWLAAIAGLVALGVRHWQAGRVTLTFVHATGAVPPLELTVFADRLTFTGPSPPAALGQRQVEGASATLAGDLVPERAVVRYRGDGVGAGIVFVTLGDDIAPIELGPARTIRGSVVEPLGFWAFGWRPAGTRAVGGAEIIAMAGGEQGIEIARTVADENGDFVLPGIAAAVDALSLRVRAPGFELGHVDVSTHRPRTSADPDIVVAPVRRTKPVRGRVLGPDDVDLEGLWVLARGLPGVQVRPDADGTFELDHVPPRAQLRLLVHGLGPFFACADVRAAISIPCSPPAIAMISAPPTALVPAGRQPNAQKPSGSTTEPRIVRAGPSSIGAMSSPSVTNTMPAPTPSPRYRTTARSGTRSPASVALAPSTCRCPSAAGGEGPVNVRRSAKTVSSSGGTAPVACTNVNVTRPACQCRTPSATRPAIAASHTTSIGVERHHGRRTPSRRARMR